MGVDPISVPDTGSIMFGLLGFRVLAAGVVCGELELLVETTADRTSCPRVPGGRPRRTTVASTCCATWPRAIGRCSCCGASGSGAAEPMTVRR